MKHLCFSLIATMLFTQVACVEFSSQICTDERLVDAPGLEGPKSLRMYNADFGVDHIKFHIEKMGTGLYGDGSVVLYRTCKIGRHLVSEIPTEFGTYMYEILRTFDGPGFYAGSLAVDRYDLELNKVPYKIVAREFDAAQRKAKSLGLDLRNFVSFESNNSYDIVVIDNSEIDADALQDISWAIGVGSILEK